MINQIIFKNKNIPGEIASEDAFGLAESIVSILLLTFLVTYSIYFISMRHSTMHKANLTAAINDEIRRDIEKLKIELWNEHYKPPNNKNPAYYETGTTILPSAYCFNIINTFNRLPSSVNRTWVPGSNHNTLKGQVRNKVFRGAPVRITRNVVSKRPINVGLNQIIDKSLVEVIYQVQKDNENIQWTSINLSSEAHSWCPPTGR